MIEDKLYNDLLKQYNNLVEENKINVDYAVNLEKIIKDLRTKSAKKQN